MERIRQPCPVSLTLRYYPFLSNQCSLVQVGHAVLCLMGLCGSCQWSANW